MSKRARVSVPVAVWIGERKKEEVEEGVRSDGEGRERISAKTSIRRRKNQRLPSFSTDIRRKVSFRSASKEYSRRDTFFRADTKGEKTDGADRVCSVGFLKTGKRRKRRHGRALSERKDCRRHEGAKALFYTHDGCRDEGEAVACGAVKARNQRTNR
jgi:hypothetical protein